MTSSLTIITIVRNDQTGLNRTMQSVSNELAFAEHLIVDGSDAPLQTLANGNIRVVLGRDRGISHAFNRGILNASGDYVMFINAGDAVAEGAGRAISAALAEPGVDCHWFPVYRESANGAVSVYAPRLRWLRYAMSAPHQGMLVKRDVFTEIGLFPLQRYSMDQYVSLRLMERAPAYDIRVHSDIVAYYPVGGHSTQGGIKPFLANCWNVARVCPARLPLAALLNGYLSIKATLARKSAFYR